jgi:N,N'-diacetyllegionaminate synthase
MNIGSFDTNKRVLVVAEIGNNHEGSYTLAEEMVGQAAQTGADAVKFQTFRTELYVSCLNKARFERLKSFELTFDQFERLSRTARNAGIIFLSTPFDLDSAEFLNSIVPAFKISSGDNNFYPLIEKVAGFGKPIILSSGLADMGEVKQAKSFIEQKWDNSEQKPGLAVLHCVSGYPVKPSEANLGAIEHLNEELGCTVGYSDHTMGIEAAVLSVALGARIIEKHFTIDKDYSGFRDHQLSADPGEMTKLVERIREVRVYLGSGKKVVQKVEEANIPLLRRSIVAKVDLAAGSTISTDDITWVRPAGGLRPGSETIVVGKRLGRPASKGETITLEHLVCKNSK